MNTCTSSAPAKVESIAIAVSPTGEEWFHGYGSLTKNRSDAIEFVSAEIAEKGIISRFGRGHMGFWQSERDAEQAAQIEYRGWSFRIEPAAASKVATAAA